MSGMPAAAESVGNQSSSEMISLQTVPGLITPDYYAQLAALPAMS